MGNWRAVGSVGTGPRQFQYSAGQAGRTRSHTLSQRNKAGADAASWCRAAMLGYCFKAVPVAFLPGGPVALVDPSGYATRLLPRLNQGLPTLRVLSLCHSWPQSWAVHTEVSLWTTAILLHGGWGRIPSSKEVSRGDNGTGRHRSITEAPTERKGEPSFSSPLPFPLPTA